MEELIRNIEKEVYEIGVPDISSFRMRIRELLLKHTEIGSVKVNRNRIEVTVREGTVIVYFASSKGIFETINIKGVEYEK